MLWSIFVWPIVFSAGLLQRLIGTEAERESEAWEDRLRYGDFFFGFLALLTAGGVALFAVIAWTTSAKLEAEYAARAGSALKDRRFSEAVVAYQRLVETHPDDRKYRFLLALAYAGSNEMERAAGLMQAMAPADETGYPPAQLWVVERQLAKLTSADVGPLREVESRLIRLRASNEVAAEATVLLVRLYFLTGRAEAVLNDPTLRAAAEGVPELHLALLQMNAGRLPAATLRGEAEKLQTHFQTKLRDEPADLAARRALIGVQLLLGNFPLVAQLLRDGLTLHPGDEELEKLWTAAVVTQAQAAQLSGASPVLRKRLAQDAVTALQRRPQSGLEYTLRLAQMQRLAGDEAEAERLYRTAVKDVPVARLELAEMLSAADRRDDAASEYAQLAAQLEALPPAERDAPGNRLLAGVASLRLGKREQAEAIFTPLAKSFPEARRWLLQTHLDAADAAEGEPTKRLAALQAALKLEPFFQPALQRLLQPLGDDETNAAARKMIVDLAAGGDAPASAYLLLGTDSILRNDLASAEKYLDLALRAAPQSPIILNNLAWSLAFGAKPNLDRALTLVQAADEKLPNHPQIQDTHGRILAKLGRWKEALAQFQACAKAYDGRADFHTALSEVYEKLALPELSKRHRERAAEITRREQESAVPPTPEAKPAAAAKPVPPS